MRSALAVSVSALLLIATAAGSAAAETLRQALAAAYVDNPTLNAKRAELRATDEQVPRALSGFRPTIRAHADWGWSRVNTEFDRRSSGAARAFLSEGKHRPSGYGFTLDQPLFEGFRNVNAVRQAKADVRAGREDLRTTEQTILLRAVTAYMDVLRDQAIVRLNENNVTVLIEQEKATKDRYETGEVTTTDVAQAEARKNGALSDLSVARADLQSSRATYEQIVGHPASGLRAPPSIGPLLPPSLEEALRIGVSENPRVRLTMARVQAALFAIRRIEGELLPTVAFEASYTKRTEPTLAIEQREELAFLIRVNVPLYQGGEVAARVRQAKETKSERRAQVDETRRRTDSDIVRAWSALVAARARIVSDRARARANGIALDGVREEERVGARTVLDVLDAEQELLDARIAVETSKRNAVVAAHALLFSIGRLDVARLGVPVQRYDPSVHYRNVKFRLFGLDPDRPGLIRRLGGRARGAADSL